MRLSNNSRSIEQSVQAYYLATTQIETTLQNAGEKLKKSPWEITGVKKNPKNSYSGSYVTVTNFANKIPLDNE